MDAAVRALGDLCNLFLTESIQAKKKKDKRHIDALLDTVNMAVELLHQTQELSDHRRACLLGHLFKVYKFGTTTVVAAFPTSAAKRNAARRCMRVICDACIAALNDPPPPPPSVAGVPAVST